MRHTLTCLLTAAALGLPGSCLAQAPLVLCFEDVPQAPWTMPNGSGLNFELLKRVEKITGDKFVFASKPWKRCMEETRNGIVDGMVGGADSPERRVFSLPPLLPDGTPDPTKAMYQDRVNLFIRTGSGASWDGKQLVNPRGVVVAQRGYFVAQLMRERGQQVLETIKSAEEGVRLLTTGAADVAVLLGQGGEHMVRNDPRVRAQVSMAKMPFVVFSFHLLIGKKSYAANPARIEAIWNAIATVRADPEYRQLEAAGSAPRDNI